MSLFAPRLFEREAALQVLQEARARAASSGGIALVSGEAGIGKTSLVTAFGESLGERAFVAVGRCDALFTPRVLGPVHDIASQLSDELRAMLDSGGERGAAFTTFLDALKRLSNPVIVFEDVHWADEATLDLVTYLGRRIGDTRALLILTYRDDELPPEAPLRGVLGELPGRRVAHVPLTPLSIEAIARMAPARFNAAELHRATAGNPFYLTEILACGEGVPASVRDAVLARAARLGPDGREVANLVSVAPGGLEAEIVEECVANAAQGAVECEQRGVLRSSGGVLRFRHEIARLAFLDAVPALARRLLNASVLEALRSRNPGGDQLARLAHHAEAAEEGASAYEYSAAAGQRAAALAAHREAAEHYARAVRFSGHVDERERAALLDAYAWECHLTDRPESVPMRREAASLWRKLGDRRREVESLARLSHLLVILGRDTEAEEAMRAAFSAIEGTEPDEAHLIAYRFHAYLRMLERDVDVSIAHARKALALAERFGDDESIIHVRNTLGSAMLVADDNGGVEHLQASLALAQARGFEYHVSNAWGNLGSASGEVHRFQQALPFLEQGIAWARSHDLDNACLYETSWLALTQLFLGRWSDAAQSAEMVLASPRASAIARIMALIAMGRLRSRRGDPGVWQVLDEALEVAERTQTLQRLAPARAARAEAAWLAGEDAAAAREAAAAMELAIRKRHAWFAGELGYWQWKGGRTVEMPDFAARPYALQVAGRWREAAEDWAARGCPFEQARALAEGDTDARLEALRIFVDLGARPAAERLRQALRASGVRHIPRGPRASTRSHPVGLTQREVQILQLIGEKLTNAEIGARLHISPKTVDHHVSAVLAKLRVGSRREAFKAAEAAGVL